MSTAVRALVGEKGLGLAQVAGVASLVAAAALVARPPEGFAGLLTAALFGIGLTLGAALFIAVQVVSGARWWWPLRGLPSALSHALAVPVAVLAVCLLFGLEALYPWAREGALAHGPLAAKAAWLQPGFFLLRAAVVLALWLGAVAWLRTRLSGAERYAARAGDGFRDPGLVRAAVAFLLLFGVTVSVSSWDWTMSLEPAWFSTMHAVYVFSGTFLGAIAAVAALAVFRHGERLVGRRATADEGHDLGKLLFAFSAFWAYIWFCEYLLIWYANIPEETEHHARRLAGGWAPLFWLNPVLNFAVPFAALLSERAKRTPWLLGRVALVVLAGRWLDTFLLAAPAAVATPGVPVVALAATVAVVAGIGLVFRRAS